MPWKSAAISTAGSLIGGLMGGSKSGERAAKDSAARAQFAQDDAKRDAKAALSPYASSGSNAAVRLSELLGIADPKGYAQKPTRDQFEDAYAQIHFKKYGKQYNRNSNMAEVNQWVEREYNKSLGEWEAGKEQYLKDNPQDMSQATLLKNFTNEDFVKDPGYTFRQMEGEKGINRGLLARGGFDSGAALKELNRYNQDYASNEFNNAYTRDAANKQRTFSMLSGTAGQGLSAAGAQIGANQNAANVGSQIQLGLGNTLNNNAQQNADNQSNLFQNTIGNLLYSYERNKASNPYRTPDFNPSMTGGSSSIPQTKFYL